MILFVLLLACSSSFVPFTMNVCVAPALPPVSPAWGTVGASSPQARYAWTCERREAVNPAEEKTANWEAVDWSSRAL